MHFGVRAEGEIALAAEVPQWQVLFPATLAASLRTILLRLRLGLCPPVPLGRLTLSCYPRCFPLVTSGRRSCRFWTSPAPFGCCWTPVPSLAPDLPCP